MYRKNKSTTKKELCLEHISQPLVIAETHVQILNSAFVSLWRQNLNRIFDWVFENLARLFWNKTWVSFLVIGKHWEFLKIWSVKSIHTCLHTSNENLDFLAELYISSLFFEIFHWKQFFSFSMSAFFFSDINYQIRI